MKTILKLSWRNLWRNKRRTLISISSVFFAVFFCVLLRSISDGVWEKLLDNILRTQAGHIQIHEKDYWDDKMIDNFMFMEQETFSQLEKINNIENISPRVETFAMVSYGTVNKGIALIGISPEKEARKSNLPSRLVEGEYLSESDEGILIGEGLSKYLKASIGDTLVLIGQGYHGANAAGLFQVRGILQMMTPEMNNAVAYTTLPATQQFIDMPNGYSGILISIKDNNKLDETIKVVNSQLQDVIGEDAENYAVYSWHFTMERQLQTGESDKAFTNVLMLVMYLIVGFGILGTIVMMTNERRREFCVMISLGMSRLRLGTVIAFELLMISLLGVLAALLITLPLTHWFNIHPIQLSGAIANTYIQFGMEPVMPMSVNSSIFSDQMIIIFTIALITVIYPMRKIFKLKITKS